MLKHLIVIVICCAMQCGFLVSGWAVEELPQHIAADNDKIHLLGRFDKDFKCAWTGSGFTITVKGGDVNVLLQDFANGSKDKRIGYRNNYFAVQIDDQEPTVIMCQKGVERYPLLENSDGKEHRITLFRRTEALFGLVQFKGLELAAAAELLAPEIKEKKFLVLGDSITCGYGNEAPGHKFNFTPHEENGFMTYAAIAARNLNAEYHCVAWSGQGLYRDRGGKTENQMPDRLLMTIPQSNEKDYDLKRYIPDYFVVNLGTNDTAKGIPPEAEYVACAEKLVATILAVAPKCQIYFCMGPMIGGKNKAAIKSYYETVAAKNDSVFVVDLPNAKSVDEAGAHWHPKVVAHQRCGDALSEAIKAQNK